MGIKRQRLIRLCKCGCGKQVAENMSNGRFKGYYRYALGHVPSSSERWTPEVKKKVSKKLRGMRHPKALPIGSRHLHHVGHGKYYWRIKVKGAGHWSYEHRHILEQALGIKLSTSDHVHHINGDSLDNRVENLIALTNSEHRIMEHLTLYYREAPHLFDLVKFCIPEFHGYRSRKTLANVSSLKGMPRHV